MKIDSLNSIIRSKNIPPVLFLFGEEEFLIHEAVESIEQALRDMGIDEFNFDRVDGEEASADVVVSMASSFPMMSDTRVVLVRRAEKLLAGRRTKNAEQSSLIRYIQQPALHTVLILVVSGDNSVNEELKGISSAVGSTSEKAKTKVRRLKSPLNLLIEHAGWMEFPRMYDRMILSWISKRFTSLHRSIDPAGAEYILSRCGNSLREIASEIDKIVTYAGTVTELRMDDIVDIVGDSREYNVFELQKAVGKRSLPNAMNIVEHMMKTDRVEMLVVTMLTRYFISLWKLVEAAEKTRNSAELAKVCGINPFFVSEYLSVLQNYTANEIEQAFTALRTADHSIKTSAENGLVILQRLLLNIMSPQISVTA